MKLYYHTFVFEFRLTSSFSLPSVLAWTMETPQSSMRKVGLTLISVFLLIVSCPTDSMG